MISFFYKIVIRLRTHSFIVIFVIFLVPPRIAPFYFEEPIFAGQAAQVTCLVSEGDLPLDISWTYRGYSNKSVTELGISTSRFGQKTSMLLIESTNAEHRGNYTCTVKSLSPLQLFSQYTAELNIHGKEKSYKSETDTRENAM